ncbi:MAG: ATP-grasp domain-containing protein [Gemmatimonadota bacterium]
MPRILLLLATTTYRAEDFLEAAQRLGVDVVVGSDQRQALADLVPDSTLELDFNDLSASTRKVVELASRRPLDAIVSAEDDGALLAAAASAELSLPHNSPESVATARYKHRMRAALARAGLPSPGFKLFSIADDPCEAAGQVEYPCVLKPVLLSASRGVIRADDEDEFARAFRRILGILQEPGVLERTDEAAEIIMVEDFVPGEEVALEGVLTNGELQVLALFDKPEPMDGPFFEESLYITPSTKPARVRERIAGTVSATAEALGLRHGPVHAELRVNEGRAWIIEIAPRSIGGLCSRTLRFGAGMSLEELILRHAAGLELGDTTRERQAAGVLMLPIPRGGVLREVGGIGEAEAVQGIEGVTISIPRGQKVVPLPEGHRYLGFIFARGETPQLTEAALREAHRRLDIIIDEPENGRE